MNKTIFWCLLAFIFACETPVEYVEVPVVDTLYVASDTVYVDSTASLMQDSPFAIYVDAYPVFGSNYGVPDGSFKVVFQCWGVKTDDREVDSLWVQGYVFNEDKTEVWDMSEAYIPAPEEGWVIYTKLIVEWASVALDMEDLARVRIGVSHRWKLGSNGF